VNRSPSGALLDRANFQGAKLRNANLGKDAVDGENQCELTSKREQLSESPRDDPREVPRRRDACH
jgi:hypothetical protein